jgi:enoyl-CoA hydratase
MTDEVITRVEGSVGRVTLNRSKALHALTTAMCEAMIEALLAWRIDPSITLIMVDHYGERGFCAGGDIRMLAESGAGDGAEARRFFHTEYRLNALMEHYPKRLVAFMDGVVMGGGVGISLPCDDRISTERTAFAMPETGIGLFPDVGGGWWLPRMPGETGMWLALTGARIKAADCLLLGVATDYVLSDRIEALKNAIVADPDAIDTLLTDAEADAGEPPLAQHQDLIDRVFGAASVEAILAALEADGSEWARSQLETLRTKSPQTLKVAFRQLRQGRALTRFADNMAMEYRIGARVVQRHDFLEGVRAVIVDKDNAPRWSPADLSGVTDAMLDEIFAPLAPDQEWTPLPQA